MMDVYLKPGDLFFGADTQVRTLLGSCVSIVLWNQRARIGGMCHFVLPTRASEFSGKYDGRYADEAMYILLDHIKNSGTRLRDFSARIYGGGDMFPGIDQAPAMKIGKKNITMAKAMLSQYGFVIDEQDVGGFYHRRVMLNLRNGQTVVQREVATTDAQRQGK